jgi:hypothetical protein
MVKYVGPDVILAGKTGKIMRVMGDWVDVTFELTSRDIVHYRDYTIEKRNLELI